MHCTVRQERKWQGKKEGGGKVSLFLLEIEPEFSDD